MKHKLSKIVVSLALLLLSVASMAAADRQNLPTGVPASAKSKKVGPLPAANRLQLAIGLPLHHKSELTSLIQQMYTPGSRHFRSYLTPAQFTEQFGPTQQEYESVINYAKANNLEVVCPFNNRALVDVAGSAADMEKMFQVNLSLYQHPKENRQFYAPDVAPSIDAGLPISYVVGLDNYAKPQPHIRRPRPGFRQSVNVANGSGESGQYLGYDFRKAYAPGVSLTGTGQIVALIELVGYNTSDITEYESIAGLPNVPLQNVVMPGNNGEPDTGNSQNAEIALDIEMVISMAPGLEKVLVLEGYTGVDVMNQLAYPSNGVPLANQASSSWDFSEGASYDSQLMEMAAQGQSFYLASGDSGAPASGIKSSSVDDNYATMVGGTELSMNGVGVSWQAETVWDYYYAGGASTGYIETDLAIPYYQHGINTTANGGSSTYRNVPDVAMCADEIEIVCTQWVSGSTYDKGQVFGVGGTSAAAPLWAAFTALVNQQAADQGRPSIGFLNPAVYSIAQGPLYTSCFHDVTVGNNIEPFEGNGEPSSGGLFTAGPGYDNCTGLGTPTGASLINALVNLGPTYVNFNYTGSTQNGTYFEPFKTLAGGVNAVISGGTIVIETAGSSSETMTITKPMNIIAQDGAATIGN